MQEAFASDLLAGSLSGSLLSPRSSTFSLFSMPVTLSSMRVMLPGRFLSWFGSPKSFVKWFILPSLQVKYSTAASKIEAFKLLRICSCHSYLRAFFTSSKTPLYRCSLKQFRQFGSDRCWLGRVGGSASRGCPQTRNFGPEAVVPLGSVWRRVSSVATGSTRSATANVAVFDLTRSVVGIDPRPGATYSVLGSSDGSEFCCSTLFPQSLNSDITTSPKLFPPLFSSAAGCCDIVTKRSGQANGYEEVFRLTEIQNQKISHTRVIVR